MSDDRRTEDFGSEAYLWERRGPPDPDVARLERLLGTLREDVAPPAFAVSSAAASDASAASGRPSLQTRAASASMFADPPRLSSAALRFIVPFALAASVLIAAGIGWLSFAIPSSTSSPTTGGHGAWEVSRIDGTPTIAAKEIADAARLPVGEWLETGEASRARIKVADVGRVDVEPRSRVGLLSTRAGNYRLQLARGTMHALIWAPPGQFVVETPSSTAIDLGCAYTLTVNDDGAGVVEVTSGWVGFEWQGRESFIPAGAVCATRPGIGPGTPHYADATPALQRALDALDFTRATPATRTAAVTQVLADARAEDAVTLWHLLTRVEGSDRDRVFDRLAAFVPAPAGVTREGIHAGRRDMLDRWWDELGLGSMSLWRGWKQGWREQGP